MLTSIFATALVAATTLGSPIVTQRTTPVSPGACTPNLTDSAYVVRSSIDTREGWSFKYGGQPGQVSEAIEIRREITNTSDPAVGWYFRIPSAMTRSYIISSAYYTPNTICVQSPNSTFATPPLTSGDCATEYGKVTYPAYFDVICDTCDNNGGVCTIYNIDKDSCATYPATEGGLVNLTPCTGAEDQKWLISPV